MFLSLALASLPDAHAERIGKKSISVPAGVSVSVDGVSALVSGDTTFDAVADVSSEVGGETVSLVETDAWLHTSTTLKALPTTDAAATVVLYDAAGLTLAQFSGTLGSDGAFTLALDCGVKECTSDVGAENHGIITVDGGSILGMDWSGSDTYAVASGTLTLAQDKSTTRYELDLDEVGALWEGTTSLAHTGEIDVRLTTYDVDGKKLDTSDVTLAPAWEDGAGGVSALSVGAGSVGGVCQCQAGFGGRDCSGECTTDLVVVSTGWTASTAPTHVALEVEGETVTSAANSFQVAAASPVTFSGTPEKDAFYLTIDGVTQKTSFTVAQRGMCVSGTCVALSSQEGTWVLSATAFSTSAASLPTSVKVGLTSALKLSAPKEASYTLTYGTDVVSVFAHALSFTADPIGASVTGEVTLLAPADTRGRQRTVSKEPFYAVVGRDRDGDLSLLGADKQATEPAGVVVVGAAIDSAKTTRPPVCTNRQLKGEGTYQATYCP